MEFLRKILVLVAILLCAKMLSAQNKKTIDDADLIQFSGVVVTGDSLMPVPFATILVKDAARGTTSDYYGYFSFVAKKNDTIQFSSIGFKKGYFIVPDTLDENRYSLIQTMWRDTVQLDEILVHPWPTQEQFREAFLNLDIPYDDIAIARKNLSPEVMEEHFDAMPMTAQMNFKMQMQERSYQIYHAGQYRPNNLLNPFAWASFIEAWKRGDFKRKD